jgi:arginine:agmatine antiporter
VGVGGAGLIAICAFLRTAGCTTGWVLVTAETSREAADQGAFPAFFRTRPGERASAVNLVTTGVLMSAVSLLTASPTLGSQFSALASVTVVLSLFTYLLAGFSLLRLRAALPTPRQRGVAATTAIVAIVCVLGLIASASLKDLGLSLICVVAAAALYLVLRRR